MIRNIVRKGLGFQGRPVFGPFQPRCLQMVGVYSFARHQRKEPPPNNYRKILNMLENSYKAVKKEALSFYNEATESWTKLKPWLLKYWQYFVLVGFGAYLISKLSSMLGITTEEMTFDELVQKIQGSDVNLIVIKNQQHILPAEESSVFKISYAYIYTPNQVYKLAIGNVTTFKERINKLQENKNFKAQIREQAVPGATQTIGNIRLFVTVTFIFANLIFFGMSIYRARAGGGNVQSSMQQGLSSKTFKAQVNLETRFKDVAGLADAKMEVMEFVDFLKHPEKYRKLGARIPKGALLSGPPGTGKTMLAKACSGEAGVPFFSASGSEFVEIFVGVGAARVREMFKAARAKTPSIVFIDEIDAIGRKREDASFRGSDERAATLNQLLVQMDGFGAHTDIIVLAATNRKELLDPALTRPGRFDRAIEITLPDLQGRKQIFMTHLAPLKLSPARTMQEYAKRLATLTPGFSGADIYNICNEAAILSARKNKKYVESIDFQMATERVIGGVEKKKIITANQRKTVAYHECGHAVVSWFLEGAHPLLKLTIIPRSKGALGFAQYLPSESSLETKQELLDRICVILGGRCSEEHFFGKITTGAADDLQKVYKLARGIVMKLGMSDKIGLMAIQDHTYEKEYSEEVNQLIDEEISKIAKECTEKCREVVKKHADKIQALALRLLEKETLDSKDIMEILGERPFPPKANYKDYLENLKGI